MGSQPSAEVCELAMQWLAARRARDYSTADRMRSDLRARGFEASEVAEAEEARQWASWEDTDEQAPKGHDYQAPKADQQAPAGLVEGSAPALAAALHPTSMGQLLVMEPEP